MSDKIISSLTEKNEQIDIILDRLDAEIVEKTQEFVKIRQIKHDNEKAIAKIIKANDKANAKANKQKQNSETLL